MRDGADMIAHRARTISAASVEDLARQAVRSIAAREALGQLAATDLEARAHMRNLESQAHCRRWTRAECAQLEAERKRK